MQGKYFALAVLLCVFCTASILTSCTEFKASPELISDEVDSLEKRAKLRSRSIGSWSSRELVGSATLFNSTNGYLHGPTISQSDAGNNFISWRVHSDLNPQTGKYVNGTTSVMHGGQFSGWQSDSPIPVFHQVGSTLPQVVVNDNDGGAYAVWVFNGNVYASVYSPVTRWGQPVLLGTGEEAWLTGNGNAGIVAVWRQQLAFNQFSINAKRHQFGDTWSSQIGMTRTAVFVNAAHPVMDFNGQLLFAWQEETPGQRGVYSASFGGLSSGLNWSQPVSVRTPKPIGSELIVSIRMASPAQTGRAQLLLQVTDSISGDGIFAYEYAQGFWQGEHNIDGNAFVSDRTQLEPFGFATNDRGNMIVAWIEEQTDNVNYFSSVYAARYTPGIGWEPPLAVSPPVFRGPVNGAPTGTTPIFLNSIDAVVDSAGEATVSWVENGPGLSELFSAHYSTLTGWKTPQLVTSYLGNSLAEAPDLALNADSPVLSWRKSTRTPQGAVYEIWFARNQSQGGSVVTPTPFDPGQPKPIGHILSSDNCLACHTTSGITVVDHTQVIGSCTSCHNGVVASGKPAQHILSTDRCDACHQTSFWFPVATVDHREVLGTCSSCHNGFLARGKGPSHIASSNECLICHNTVTWFTAITQPTPNTGPITPTTPKPVGHMPTTNMCFSCHVGGSPLALRVDHAQVIGSCGSCHDGVTASGKSLAHYQTSNNCDACHATNAWRPVVEFDHVESTEACFSCHNGVVASGKSPNHIVSSNQCEQCHSFSSWQQVNPVTPINSGPVGSWSSPIAVWTNGSTATANDYVHGPELVAAPNNINLSLVKHSQFNGLTGRYELSENFVYRSPDGSIWNRALPAPRADMLNATMVQTKVSPLSGRAFALWSKQGELFFSDSISLGSWSAPQSLGQVDGQYNLLQYGDSVVAVWREAIGPNRVAINARSYNSSGVWTNSRRMEVSESASFAEPVIDSSGQLYIVRQELLSNSSGGQTLFLYYNTFSELSGWSTDVSLPSLPLQVYTPISLRIASAGQGRVFVLAGAEGIVGINDSGLFVYSSGTGNGWQRLLSPSASFVGKPDLVASPQGHAMAVWLQSEPLGINGPSYQIYVSTLQAFASLWDAPIRLGNLSDRFETDPKLIMRQDGEVLATWVSDISAQSILYTRHYSPIGGWSSTAQPAIINDVSTNGYTMSPNIQMSSSGEYYLAWKQVLKDQFTTQYSIWVSKTFGLF